MTADVAVDDVVDADVVVGGAVGPDDDATGKNWIAYERTTETEATDEVPAAEGLGYAGGEQRNCLEID